MYGMALRCGEIKMGCDKVGKEVQYENNHCLNQVFGLN